jgi:hypothetical protein
VVEPPLEPEEETAEPDEEAAEPPVEPALEVERDDPVTPLVAAPVVDAASEDAARDPVEDADPVDTDPVELAGGVAPVSVEGEGGVADIWQAVTPSTLAAANPRRQALPQLSVMAIMAVPAIDDWEGPGAEIGPAKALGEVAISFPEEGREVPT